MENTLKELTEYFQYLDDLRESVVTNMFGAPPYLQEEFGLTKPASVEIWKKWTETFGDSSPEDRAKEVLEDA